MTADNTQRSQVMHEIRPLSVVERVHIGDMLGISAESAGDLSQGRRAAMLGVALITPSS